MAKMKVTYMNKGTGHGNMGDQHTFIRCPACKGKYVKEKYKICPHCAGEGKGTPGTNPESKAAFDAAVEKEVAKKLAERSAAEQDAKIAAEVEADNAIEEAAQKAEEKADSKSKK